MAMQVFQPYKVRVFRRLRKVSQRDLSNVCGLGISYLSKLENGHVTPRVDTVALIADLLAVPLIDFFRDVADEEEYIKIANEVRKRYSHKRGKPANMRLEVVDEEDI